MIRASTTDKLLDELNKLRGKQSRDIGFLYYADIKGDSYQSRRKVYQIVNAAGGVTYSPLNGRHSRETCQRIREAIERETPSFLKR